MTRKNAKNILSQAKRVPVNEVEKGRHWSRHLRTPLGTPHSTTGAAIFDLHVCTLCGDFKIVKLWNLIAAGLDGKSRKKEMLLANNAKHGRAS